MSNTIHEFSQAPLIDFFKGFDKPKPPLTPDLLAQIFSRNLGEGKSAGEIASEIFIHLPASKQTPQTHTGVEEFAAMAVRRLVESKNTLEEAPLSKKQFQQLVKDKVSLTGLPDALQEKLKESVVEKIIAQGIRHGQTVDDIAMKIFKKLPKEMETDENLRLITEYARNSVNSFFHGFNEAIEFVLDSEGGFGDHPNDRGGKTKFGISQKAYPNLDIKNLTLEEAKQIYERDYWKKSGADKADWPMNLIIFDTAVNMGVGRAHKFLAKSEADPEVFLEMREDFYRVIARNNPKQQVFLRGWLNRLEALRQKVGVNNE